MLTNAIPILSTQERQALKDLANDDSIIIHNADKGAAVVLQNKEAHCTEIMYQLNKTDVYTSLS